MLSWDLSNSLRLLRLLMNMSVVIDEYVEIYISRYMHGSCVRVWFEHESYYEYEYEYEVWLLINLVYLKILKKVTFDSDPDSWLQFETEQKQEKEKENKIGLFNYLIRRWDDVWVTHIIENIPLIELVSIFIWNSI